MSKDGGSSTRTNPADAATDKRSAVALAKVANSQPDAAQDGKADEGDKPKDAEVAAEHKVDVKKLSEEQLKDIIYLKAGKAAGKERYDANKKPPLARDPKKTDPAEDTEYDFETWESAKQQLEKLEVQHDEGAADGLVGTPSVDPDEGEDENEPKYDDGKWERSRVGGVGVSSNNASRAERGAADDKVDAAQTKVDEIAETKGHHGRGAANRQLAQAGAAKDKVYDKTKDPLGDDKKKIEKDEQTEAREHAAEQKEAIDKLKLSQAAFEAAQRKVENPATGEGANEKNAQAKADAAKAKADLQAALDHAKQVGADRGPVGKAYDAIKKNTEVEMGGALITKAATTGNHGLYNEKHDGTPGVLGTTTEGETNVLSARADAKARLGVSNGAITAEAAVGGKATLVDVKEQWKWEMPGHFLGEAVNFRLFFEVAGMIGVEAHAQLKANVGKMNPKEPKIDMNAVSAGVDGFAGMKASLSVGTAFEWQKQNVEAYQAKTEQAGKVIVDLIIVRGQPAALLGFLLRQTNGDVAAKNIMAHLMKWGQAGTVPLAAIEAVIEGSLGIGAQAHASIGLRGGHFDFMTQANATWGVGVGGKVKVSLDVIEGPKFALITLGELRPVAIKFAQEEVQKGIDTGANFVNGMIQGISDWWHSKDKAHELVKNKVPSVLPAAKNVEVIQALFGWYCKEEDQFAIVDVMLEMSKRGQIDAIPAAVKQQIMEKTDGNQHRLAAHMMGWQPWKS